MATFDFLNSNGLDNSYQNTIDFDNLNAQQTFWDSQVITSVITNVTTSRILGTGTITLDISLENALNLNYCRLNQDGKDWYFFIVDRQFINENTTTFTIELDVMQTFMFDYEILTSYVIREHQDRWTTGYLPIFSLTQENVELGDDYVEKTQTELKDGAHIWYYVYASAPLGNEWDAQGQLTESKNAITTCVMENNSDTQIINTGFYVYLFSEGSTINGTWGSAPIEPMVAVTSLLDDPRIVKIVATRYTPKGIVYNSNENNYSYISGNGITANLCRYIRQDETSPTFNEMLKIVYFINNDYSKEYIIPDSLILGSSQFSINNTPDSELETKLYTYPYNFFRINAINNFFNLYRENFNLTGSKYISIGNGIANQTNLVLIPMNYLNENYNLFKMNFTQNNGEINLISDAWKNYYSQNNIAINGGLAVRFLQGVVSAPSPTQGAINTIFTGVNELIDRQRIKNQPDSISQTANDTYTPTLLNKMTVKVSEVELKPQFKDKIFKFFQQFGYLTNELKVPNLKSRYYFNFVQIAGAVINSSIANTFINQIRAILQRGITFWHYRNASTWHGIANYNYENLEMSIYNKQQEVNTNAIINSWF